jgi:5S rRNA maturation endonuclease (ribonuclease M5)
MFVESRYPSAGGWMHWTNKPDKARTTQRPQNDAVAQTIDFNFLAGHYVKAATNATVVSLAKSLGVAFDALRRLQVGWDGEAATFPMCDATGRIIGIRRRFPDSKKLSVRGGREGLFMPQDLNGENPLCVCEGATDTAALLTIGVMAVGRPSCSGGVAYLKTLCVDRCVVIVADNDAPGLRGARQLKEQLDDASVIVPPAGIKDARSWIAASKESFMETINEKT